ncbi:MAG: HD domain-containing protein [Candidatus Hydrogenedentales bacterium]|jgi:putative hydrolase of HD superfamily
MSAANAERVERVLEFLETIDRLKSVERRGWLADGSRRENSAEHSWHVCMYALLLHGELAASVDFHRLLCLLLVHDIVEVYAGDTYVYDEQQMADQHAREGQAAQRLFAILPDDLADYLRGLWEEFEAQATPEARAARALDMAHGFSQNVFSGGKGWRQHGVSEAMSRNVNRPAWEFDPALGVLYEQLYARAERESSWTTGNPDAERSTEVQGD